jgi:hypothetical protein
MFIQKPILPHHVTNLQRTMDALYTTSPTLLSEDQIFLDDLHIGDVGRRRWGVCNNFDTWIGKLEC